MSLLMENCIEWDGFFNKDGYGYLRVGNRGNVGAHRVAYCKAANIPLADINGQLVMHTCDNRRCVNPNHLKLGTPADNSADMVSKNRSCKGEKHPRRKLSDEDVLTIRKIYKPRSGAILAKLYNVSTWTIHAVMTRKKWSHIP